MQDRFRRLGGKGVVWVEPARAWLELAKQAGKTALSDDYSEIKRLIGKIGSNRRILDKKVKMEVVPPFDILSAYGDLLAAEPGKKKKDTDRKSKSVLLSSETGN